VIDPAGELTHDGVIPVRDLVEKPSPDEAPSNFILTGRYVLTADAWDEIDRAHAGQRWRAAAHRCAAGPGGAAPFHAVVADESRLDTGTPARLPDGVDRARPPRPRTRRPDLREFLSHLHL
jgi:UTP--glucose-1-phosphate uridylyltransferase